MDILNLSLGRRFTKGRDTCKHLKNNSPRRPDVSRYVVEFTFPDLRSHYKIVLLMGHIIRCYLLKQFWCLLWVSETPKLTDVSFEKDILRWQILIGELQCEESLCRHFVDWKSIQYLSKYFYHLAFTECPVCDSLLEGPTFAIFHHKNPPFPGEYLLDKLNDILVV